MNLLEELISNALENKISEKAAIERAKSLDFQKSLEVNQIIDVANDFTVQEVVNNDKPLNIFLLLKIVAEAKGVDDETLTLIDSKRAACDFSMGSKYMDDKRFDKAETHYMRSLEIYKKKGLHGEAATCDMYLGIVYGKRGRFIEAETSIIKARLVFEEISNGGGMAVCDVHLGNVYRELGLEKAKEHLEKAKFFYNNENVIDVVSTMCNMSLGDVYLELRRFEEAKQHFEKAKLFYEKNNMREDALECDIYIGDVYRGLGHYGKAITVYVSVSEKIEDSTKYDPEFQRNVFYKLGLRYREIKESDKAKHAFKRAIDVIRNHRTMQSNDATKTDILQDALHVYQSMIDLCVERDDFNSALEYVEETKSQNLAEKLYRKALITQNIPPDIEEDIKESINNLEQVKSQLNAIGAKFQDNPNSVKQLRLKFCDVEEKMNKMNKYIDDLIKKCDPEYDPNNDPEYDPNSYPDINTRISYTEISELIRDDKTVIIEFYPMLQKTIVFVIFRAKPIKETTIILKEFSVKDLMAKSKTLNEYKRNRSCKKFKPFLEKTLGEFYNKIFRPIKQLLDNSINKIIFIPYHALHFFPLQAMWYEENGKRKYLIDDYSVTFATSSAILKHCINISHTDIMKLFWLKLGNSKALYKHIAYA